MNMTKKPTEKLPRIDEVNMLNLGLRKTKQETTAPQIVSFHRTPQREKQTSHTEGFEITATTQFEILITASPQ